jgi:hypothetical protein
MIGEQYILYSSVSSKYFNNSDKYTAFVGANSFAYYTLIGGIDSPLSSTLTEDFRIHLHPDPNKV